MLTKEECLRLSKLLDEVDKLISGGDAYGITFGDIQWLAVKLQECQLELTNVYTPVADKLAPEVFDDINRDLREIYKNPKNEISDRFYPR